MDIEIELLLKPKACPRPRIAVRGKFAHAYYPKTYSDWKAEILDMLQNAYPDDVETPIFEGPVYLEVINYMKRPKTTKRTYPPYDLDNYVKSVMDGITSHKGIWKDDDQVCVLTTSKEYAEEDKITIKIQESNLNEV